MKLKLLCFAALLSLAAGAGYLGSLFNNPGTEVVQAAPDRQPKSIRIATINLEEASRQSKWFKALKNDWERAQEDIKQQSEKMKADYQAKVEEYQRARLRGDDPSLLISISVEIKALEEAQKAAREEQTAYLQALLNQYQKDVLLKVMDELERYVKLEGYDMVLQDYTLESEEAGFFQDNVYSQTLMSKPVLHVPGATANPYVTDITQPIIDRIK